MNKINKKPVILGLKILTILAFALIFMPTNKAAAAYGTNTFYQTNNGSFSDVNNPKPFIDSINPKSSNLGVGTKTITIMGSGFVPSSIVRLNGVNRSATFIDDSHLLVQINGNDLSAYRTNGGFFITVLNGEPGGGFSNAAFFTINSAPVAPVMNNNYGSSTTNFSDTNSNNNFTDTTQTPNATTTDFNENYSNLASNAVFGSNSFLPSGLMQWVLFAIIILLIIIVVRKLFGARQNYEETPMKHS